MELGELYTEVITEYSRSKKHKRHLKDPTVALRGVNPSCGDDIKLELKIKNGIIQEAGFSGSGCAISEASTAVMSELIEGKSTEEAGNLINLFIGMIQNTVTCEKELDELQEAQAFKDISRMPARVKCAVLSWHTLEEALKIYAVSPAPGREK